MATCMVVTHAHIGWQQPSSLDANIRSRIRQERPDKVITLDNKAPYNVRGAEHFPSRRGEMPVEARKMIGEYDRLLVSGQYWDGCHLETFYNVLDSVGRTAQVILPLDCISTLPVANRAEAVHLVSDGTHSARSYSHAVRKADFDPTPVKSGTDVTYKLE